MKHYEVWVTLEKWDGDSKLEDIETCKIGNANLEGVARRLFNVVQTSAITGVLLTDLPIEVYDD